MEQTTDAIRAELAQRITALDARVDRGRSGELARELDQVRAIAHRWGMQPAVTVAHLLDAAFARGEHGALVHGWLSILRDAVHSDRHDRAACDAFAAACSVRLTG